MEECAEKYVDCSEMFSAAVRPLRLQGLQCLRGSSGHAHPRFWHLLNLLWAKLRVDCSSLLDGLERHGVELCHLQPYNVATDWLALGRTRGYVRLYAVLDYSTVMFAVEVGWRP